MTRDNKPAAPSAAYRAASLLTGALMIFGLAGCGGMTGGPEASLAQKAKPTVAFSPVQGVPQKYAAKVNDQLAASLKEKGVAIVESKDADYVIKAQYLAAPEAKKGTKITYAIDVVDKGDNKVRHFDGDEIVSEKRGGDSWSHVTDEGIQKVVMKSSGELNAWIANPVAPAPAAASAATAAPAAGKTKVAGKSPAAGPSMAAATEAPATKSGAALHGGELVAVVPAVSGAPGDGKTALSEAMKRSLSQQGVKIASATVPGAYKIQGQVDLGATENGEQKIQIKWVVVDPAGRAMPKAVVQNNKVAEGSLDKNWGDIADQAAGAAAMEVVKLLNKTPTGQAQQTPTGSAG